MRSNFYRLALALEAVEAATLNYNRLTLPRWLRPFFGERPIPTIEEVEHGLALHFRREIVTVARRRGSLRAQPTSGVCV
jgi:hypothetical protein